MKKYLYILASVMLLAFLAFGCGENKEAKEEGAQEDIGQAYDQDTTEMKSGEEQKEEMEEEVKESPAAFQTDYTQAPLTGMVVNFNALVMGRNGETTPNEAMKLADNGQLLTFLADNGRVYFVYNTDGSYASKALSKHAEGKTGIYGKAKQMKGLNFIIATKFADVNP